VAFRWDRCSPLKFRHWIIILFKLNSEKKVNLKCLEVFHPLDGVFVVDDVRLVHGDDERQFGLVEDAAGVQHVLETMSIFGEVNNSFNVNALLTWRHLAARILLCI